MRNQLLILFETLWRQWVTSRLLLSSFILCFSALFPLFSPTSGMWMLLCLIVTHKSLRLFVHFPSLFLLYILRLGHLNRFIFKLADFSAYSTLEPSRDLFTSIIVLSTPEFEFAFSIYVYFLSLYWYSLFDEALFPYFSFVLLMWFPLVLGIYLKQLMKSLGLVSPMSGLTQRQILHCFICSLFVFLYMSNSFSSVYISNFFWKLDI